MNHKDRELVQLQMLASNVVGYNGEQREIELA